MEEQQKQRTTGRIKKPKAVFDPSDNYLPKKMSTVSVERRASSRMSTASSDGSSIIAKEACVVCGKRESKRFAAKNRLISCLECESKIHKLCLNVDYDDEFEEVRKKYKCENCSPCCVCEKTGRNVDNDEVLLVCSKCTNLYHNLCLESKTIKAGEEQPRDWKCPKCVPLDTDSNGTDFPVKKIHEIIGSQVQPQTAISTIITSTTTLTTTAINNNTPTLESKIKRPYDDINNEETPSHEEGPEDEKRAKSASTDGISFESNSSNAQPQPPSVENVRRSPINPAGGDDIPCVENWSVDEVYGYFHKHFPKEAYLFKDHDIDGRSLLLLKRSDVVKKLPLKLGPSLRLYSVILKIQSQLNDQTLGWN